MATPITRKQLQDLVSSGKTRDLMEIVSTLTRETVLHAAQAGRTSIEWTVSRGDVECRLDEMGWANSRATLEDIVAATKALYVDCDVTVMAANLLRIDWS